MLIPTIIENQHKADFLAELKRFLAKDKIVIESVNYSTGVSESDEIWYSALIIWRELTKEEQEMNN